MTTARKSRGNPTFSEIFSHRAGIPRKRESQSQPGCGEIPHIYGLTQGKRELVFVNDLSYAEPCDPLVKFLLRDRSSIPGSFGVGTFTAF